MVGPRPKNAAANKSRAIHSMAGTKLYKLWVSMRDRCENPRSEGYFNYGARGIYVCPAWARFEAFLADMGKPGPNQSLERLDNDGPYAPWNCKWASKKEQGRNKRNNHRVTAFAETKCLSEWAEDVRCRVCLRTLITRIWRGWEPEMALCTPPVSSGRRFRSPVPEKEGVTA